MKKLNKNSRKTIFFSNSAAKLFMDFELGFWAKPIFVDGKYPSEMLAAISFRLQIKIQKNENFEKIYVYRPNRFCILKKKVKKVL